MCYVPQKSTEITTESPTHMYNSTSEFIHKIPTLNCSQNTIKSMLCESKIFPMHFTSQSRIVLLGVSCTLKFFFSQKLRVL